MLGWVCNSIIKSISYVRVFFYAIYLILLPNSKCDCDIIEKQSKVEGHLYPDKDNSKEGDTSG